MTRKIALLFASTLMFTVAACDSTDETVEDRAADAPDANDVAAHHGMGEGHHGKFNPADKLCAELECTDAQAVQVSELFASAHEGRKAAHGDRDDAAHEAHKAERLAANTAIADAFRADEFDASVLDRARPDHDGDIDHADHEAKMVEFAAELHAILTPAQRAELADKIEAGGPMFFAGHHGKMGKHGGKGMHGKMMGKHGKHGDKADRDPAEHLAKKVDALCEPISCTAEQKTQLSSTFEGVHQAHAEARTERQANKPDFKPLADLFRAETFDQAKVRAVMAEHKADKQDRKAGHGQEFGSVLAEIHDLLTPEQRGILADKIAADGLHSIMGGKGHGKQGHGKKGHGKHGPECDAD